MSSSDPKATIPSNNSLPTHHHTSPTRKRRNAEEDRYHRQWDKQDNNNNNNNDDVAGKSKQQKPREHHDRDGRSKRRRPHRHHRRKRNKRRSRDSPRSSSSYSSSSSSSSSSRERSKDTERRRRDRDDRRRKEDERGGKSYRQEKNFRPDESGRDFTRRNYNRESDAYDRGKGGPGDIIYEGNKKGNKLLEKKSISSSASSRYPLVAAPRIDSALGNTHTKRHQPKRDWVCACCRTSNFFSRHLCIQCNLPYDPATSRLAEFTRELMLRHVPTKFSEKEVKNVLMEEYFRAAYAGDQSDDDDDKDNKEEEEKDEDMELTEEMISVRFALKGKTTLESANGDSQEKQHQQQSSYKIAFATFPKKSIAKAIFKASPNHAIDIGAGGDSILLGISTSALPAAAAASNRLGMTMHPTSVGDGRYSSQLQQQQQGGFHSTTSGAIPSTHLPRSSASQEDPYQLPTMKVSVGASSSSSGSGIAVLQSPSQLSSNYYGQTASGSTTHSTNEGRSLLGEGPSSSLMMPPHGEYANAVAAGGGGGGSAGTGYSTEPMISTNPPSGAVDSTGMMMTWNSPQLGEELQVKRGREEDSITVEKSNAPYAPSYNNIAELKEILESINDCWDCGATEPQKKFYNDHVQEVISQQQQQQQQEDKPKAPSVPKENQAVASSKQNGKEEEKEEALKTAANFDRSDAQHEGGNTTTTDDPQTVSKDSEVLVSGASSTPAAGVGMKKVDAAMLLKKKLEEKKARVLAEQKQKKEAEEEEAAAAAKAKDEQREVNSSVESPSAEHSKDPGSSMNTGTSALPAPTLEKKLASSSTIARLQDRMKALKQKESAGGAGAGAVSPMPATAAGNEGSTATATTNNNAAVNTTAKSQTSGKRGEDQQGGTAAQASDYFQRVPRVPAAASSSGGGPADFSVKAYTSLNNDAQSAQGPASSPTPTVSLKVPMEVVYRVAPWLQLQDEFFQNEFPPSLWNKGPRRKYAEKKST